MTKRIFDLSLAILAIPFLLCPLILIAIMVRCTSTGPIFYWSSRVGKNGELFMMPKFRTMLVTTPQVATHLLHTPTRFVTPIGSFLRKLSLDELPQLYSIFSGDMSFVGPRPALFNQDDLIYLRKSYGVDDLLPGLTGWAQVNGRDEISIEEKVLLDCQYKKKMSLVFDLYIVWRTFFKVISGSGIKH